MKITVAEQVAEKEEYSYPILVRVGGNYLIVTITDGANYRMINLNTGAQSDFEKWHPHWTIVKGPIMLENETV